MIEIVPVLADTLSALETIEVHPGIPLKYRVQVNDLKVRLRVRIDAYRSLGNEPDDIEILYEIKRHSLNLREAVHGLQFPDLVGHGVALMDALPGPPQSKRKRPPPPPI